MKKEVEVFIIVVCDQEPNKYPSSKLIASVKRQIEKINGIIDTSLSVRTADIGVSSLLDEKDIPSMVDEIKKINRVDKVNTKILIPLKKS